MRNKRKKVIFATMFMLGDTGYGHGCIFYHHGENTNNSTHSGTMTMERLKELSKKADVFNIDNLNTVLSLTCFEVDKYNPINYKKMKTKILANGAVLC